MHYYITQAVKKYLLLSYNFCFHNIFRASMGSLSFYNIRKHESKNRYYNIKGISNILKLLLIGVMTKMATISVIIMTNIELKLLNVYIINRCQRRTISHSCRVNNGWDRVWMFESGLYLAMIIDSKMGWQVTSLAEFILVKLSGVTTEHSRKDIFILSFIESKRE